MNPARSISLRVLMLSGLMALGACVEPPTRGPTPQADMSSREDMSTAPPGDDMRKQGDRAVIKPPMPNVEVGEPASLALHDAETDMQLTPGDITWSSDDPEVIAYDAAADAFVGVSPGQAQITAELPGYEPATTTAQVRPATFSEIRFDPPLIIAPVGEDVEVTAHYTNSVGATAEPPDEQPFCQRLSWALRSLSATSVTELPMGESATLGPHTLELHEPGHHEVRVECIRPNGELVDATLPVRVLPEAPLGAGRAHTCANTGDDQLTCWGRAQRGQLNGSLAQFIPEIEPEEWGQDLNAWMVDGGEAHTCALVAGGNVRCWGDNEYGQSNPTTEPTMRWAPVSPITVQHPMGERFMSVHTAGSRTCALDERGAAWCWGERWPHEPGRVSGVRPLPGLQRWRALAIGPEHGCAVSLDGEQVWCWGEGAHGEHGQSQPLTGPARVNFDGARLLTVQAGQDTSCALSVDGEVWCWGSNQFSLVGHGLSSTTTPMLRFPNNAKEVAELVMGHQHACVRGTNDQVWCWGSNAHAQLGDPNLGPRDAQPAGATSRRVGHAPQPIASPGVSFGGLAAGAEHTCGRTTEDAIWCWGSRRDGRIPSPSDTALSILSQHVGVASPQRINFGERASLTRFAMGEGFFCGITQNTEEDVSFLCRGLNGRGQTDSVGLPTLERSSPPVAGHAHACLAGLGGQLRCWGDRRAFTPAATESGVLDLIATTQPVDPMLGGQDLMAAGRRHTCWTSASSVECAGFEDRRQLRPYVEDQPQAFGQTRRMVMNRTVKKIVSHTDDTCTLSDIGVLLCWGYWTHRQRWGSELNSASSGRRINDILDADPELRDVAIGERHGCAVSHRHDGSKVYCWGTNDYGQLGQGASGPAVSAKMLPVLLADGQALRISEETGAADVVDAGDTGKLAAGANHSCAIDAQGKLYCWGANVHFQTFPAGPDEAFVRLQNTPRHILPMRTFSRVFAHGDTTCAIAGPDDPIEDGALLCWGADPGGIITEGEKERPVTAPLEVWSLPVE